MNLVENVAQNSDVHCLWLKALSQVKGVRLVGTATDKASVMSFMLAGYTTEEVGKALNEEGIAVRTGHHCCQPVMDRLGIPSTTRASFALYNTRADIDAMIDSLSRYIATARPKPLAASQSDEFAFLTNIIHQEWTGLTVKKHKDSKGLKSQNLRDHMSEAELIFTALAELSTRQIAETEKAKGVQQKDFNQYGARRGNDDVMVRGTFANIRIKNEMVPGTEGGVTKFAPTNEVMPIYDAAMKYKATNTPLVVVGGKEYGTGSSRDWAAKGTNLLGVKAVICESFERIHRSNLIGMGVIPLQFHPGTDRKTLKLDGTESMDIIGIEKGLKPQQDLDLVITRTDGKKDFIKVKSRIDTAVEVEYYKNGGILHYVLRKLVLDN